MNVLKLVIEAIKAQGKWLVVAWIALNGAFILLFRVAGDRPLDAEQLTGLVISTGVVVLAVGQAQAWWARRRRGSAPVMPRGTGGAP